MAKSYDKKLLEEENILEWEDTFYVLNPKKSFAFIALPFNAVKKKDWNNNTKFKIRIKPVENES